MEKNFKRTSFGATGFEVTRMGFSASYRPGVRAVREASDLGINFFFGYGIDTQLKRGLREAFGTNRERFVLATGAYNFIFGYPNLRRTLEKRLREFRTEYIDVFLFLGVTKGKQMPPEVLEELARFRDEGKVKAIGLSCHDRRFVGQLAAKGAVDTVMMRYNAAHRGAEKDIFPYLKEHDPGVISYTATRWTALLRRPKGWPKESAIPTAGQCYRFVLSNPHVHVCLTSPTNVRQLRENFAALDEGPLSGEELSFMKTFGDAVYGQHKWFM